MSYEAQTVNGSITIHNQHIQEATKALRESEIGRKYADDWFGHKLEDLSLAEAIEAVGFEVDVWQEQELNIVYYAGRTSTFLDDLFAVLAPYVEENSEFTWAGEDGSLWRSLFTGGIFREEEIPTERPAANLEDVMALVSDALAFDAVDGRVSIDDALTSIRQILAKEVFA